jgi:osmoprotectant transport system ATP-binding protein
LGTEMRDRYPAQLSGGQRQRVGVARALAVDPPLMLMDEPFGAIDPINRERLQNQFLRLQSEIRKTILFVTHDIDEAIKMGDRVAVLEKGGVLSQYATPAELLMSPANDFVEDFVGADRALKRLSLLRVRDVDLWKAPLVRVGEPIDSARAAIDGADLPHPLVTDELGRPLGWLSDRDLAGATVPATPDAAPYPIIELDDVLRDALSDLLQSETQYGPVVDSQGRVAGVLSVEIVSEFLTSDDGREATTDPADRVAT